MKEVLPETFTRYNGGWIKKVDYLNKEYTNGYSLVGDFCSKGKQWLSPGLYVDCSIGGSRKNWTRSYSLIRLNHDGTAEELVGGVMGRSWAVELWDEIEKNLPDFKSKRQKLCEEKESLYHRIEEIDKELVNCASK